MDYEREPGSELGDSSADDEQSMTDLETTPRPDDMTEGTSQAADEGNVFDENPPTDPESVQMPVTTDIGDDSDAPIHLDDVPAASDAASNGAAMEQQVRAENVTLTQGGAQSIEATTVSISQGGAGQVRAEELTIHQGGVGLARAGHLTVQSQSSAFAVVADNAQVEEGANVFLLLSRSTSGEVRPTIDWRSALAFGAGIGLVVSILRRRR